MTVFIFTWNNTFLTTPADTEDESLGAQRIRDTRNAVGERLKVDHSLAGDANDGKHLKITFPATATAAPIGLDAGNGRLFASGAAGNTELFYQDSSGRILQLTASGSVNTPAVVSPIPSGTIMLFAQPTVPAGWNLVTGFEDHLIYIFNDTGGQTGGSWSITGLSTNSHVLTVNELPPHQHEEFVGQGSGGGLAAWSVVSGNTTSDAGFQTGATGGGAGHDHGAVNSDSTWRPQYLSVVLGQKI